MATSNQIAAVAVPVLFVVVSELSSAAREMDLAAIAEDRHDAFLFTPLSDWFPFPELGRFNFIHGMNTILFSVGIGMESLFLTDGSFFQISMIVVTWLGWVILPAIEVEDYDRIFKERVSSPHSVQIHTAGTMIGTVYVYLLPQLLLESSTFTTPAWIGPVIILVFSLLAIAYPIYALYLLRLTQELNSSRSSNTSSRD